MSTIVHPLHRRPEPAYASTYLAETADSVQGAAGAAASIEYATAGNYQVHCIDSVLVSFDTAPGAPVALEINDGAAAVFFKVNLAAAAGQVLLPVAKRFPAGAVHVHLAAPGGAVVANVNVIGHRLEQTD